MSTFRNYTFLAFSIVFLIGFNTSCKTTSKGTKEITKLENALLWEITGPNTKKPSYIFGTIHIIDADRYFLPEGMMTAFESSSKVFFEIDMAEMSDMSAMMGIMGKIFMKDNKTLKDLLNEQEYTLVTKHFEKMGLPLFFIEKMKPMFLSVFANADFDPNSLQNGNMKSYEMELYQLAQSTKKPTAGLETIDFQISLFDEIPYEAQAKMLVDAISKSGNTEDDQFKMMMDMYTSQDIEAMVSMISEESNEIAGFEDKLVNKRNENWIPLIINQAKKEPSFFAVGAGHLGGKNGVIRLLQKEGWKVKPIIKK